jgi:hypothetical protein
MAYAEIPLAPEAVKKIKLGRKKPLMLSRDGKIRAGKIGETFI